MTANRPAPPSVDLVRRTTDRRVTDALITSASLTRPEIASLVGISKPTVSESIRRLTERGLIDEAGITTGGRGRASRRYRLSDDIGVGLAVYAGPLEVVAEVVDVRGEVRTRATRPIGLTATPRQLSAILRSLLAECEAAAPGPVVARVVSVADPVDREGRTLAMESSPFLTAPADLRRSVGGDALIGNDVNWAALAELTDGAGERLNSFLYLYLGSGLGSAIVDEGRVVVGGQGLAGEIAYTLTRGPGGRGMSLLHCFRELEFTVGSSTVIDADAVRAAFAAGDPRTEALVTALAGSLGSSACMLSPDRIVVGGPWAGAPGLIPRLAAATEQMVPYAVPVSAAEHSDGAALAGARIAAADAVRAALHRAVA
ncbi:MAG: ROK family transcriptional regulator [Tetrasphaera sp.]